MKTYEALQLILVIQRRVIKLKFTMEGKDSTLGVVA